MTRQARPKLRVTLVADDLSPGAGLALGRAGLLPGSRGLLLDVLRVRPAGSAGHGGVDDGDLARAALQRRAERLVRGRRPRTGAGPRISATVVEGQPFVEIVRHARLLEADLVLVGAHRRRTWRDALLGTTTERVIRKGDVPVLVVKRPPRGPYRRAIAAIEATDAATRIVDLAAALLDPPRARLTVLHCFTVPFESEISGGVRALVARDRLAYRVKRTAACERIVASASGSRAVPTDLQVVHGDPVVEVVRRIGREGADLLVLGTHARSGVAHTLLGSTAEALIRAAPCDVAVTRPARFTFEMP